MKLDIKHIVIISLFIAIFVILDRFIKIELSVFKLSLAAIPIITAAFVYGFKTSVLIALVGSFLSQLFSEYGLTITTFLWMVPAIVRAVICSASYNKKFKNQVLSIIISSIVVTILNTIVMIIDAKIFGYNSRALELAILFTRFAASIFSAIIFIIVVPVICAVIKKIDRKEIN